MDTERLGSVARGRAGCVAAVDHARSLQRSDPLLCDVAHSRARHESRGSASTGTLVCRVAWLPDAWCATRTPRHHRDARTPCCIRGWLLLAQLPEMPHPGTG